MSFFLHRHEVTLPKLNFLFQNFKKQLKTVTRFKLDNNILSIIAQSLKLKYRLSFDLCFIIRECPDFCQIYYRNNRELLLKHDFVTLIYRKLHEINENQASIRRIKNNSSLISENRMQKRIILSKVMTKQNLRFLQ